MDSGYDDERQALLSDTEADDSAPVLHVIVEAARNLDGLEEDETSNPYVIVRCGNLQQQTGTTVQSAIVIIS